MTTKPFVTRTEGAPGAMGDNALIFFKIGLRLVPVLGLRSPVVTSRTWRGAPIWRDTAYRDPFRVSYEEGTTPYMRLRHPKYGDAEGRFYVTEFSDDALALTVAP